MSSFNLVDYEEDLRVPGHNQQCGYITCYGLVYSHAKYHCFKLEHVAVMTIWNMDARQRQIHPTLAVYVSFK